MKDNRIKKFENHIRLNELDPLNTLKRAGFREGMSLCDIGAGTGVFSFPAAEISGKEIYALDISDSMVDLLEKRRHERGLKNLKVIKLETEVYPINEKACDMVILVTVFHEINDKNSTMVEIRRILNDEGRVLVIDFHKAETPMGPPIDHRISEEDVKREFTRNNFKFADRFSLGDNFYGIIFTKH